jgi:signal transduction histidine kinase
MNNSVSFRLAANEWVIRARWLYILTIATICVIFRAEEIFDLNWTSPAAILSYPLTSVLLLAILLNALLYVTSRIIDLETAHRHTGWLSFLQVTIDITSISLLLYDLAGGQSIVPALYFIPIVESIVLFGQFGPLLVAILIGAILNGFAYLSEIELFRPLFSETNSRLVPAGAIFTWSLILSVVYLIIGVVSSYIARQIALREQTLEREAAEHAVQMNSLKNFNTELEREERNLESKDFELEMANRRLMDLEEAKSKFVSVTAHQLRTPLSAIKWTFDMIVSGQLGPVNDEQKEFLRKGFDSTQRMIRIVNDLLHVDHMEADKIEYHFSPVSLADLIDSVKFEFVNQAASKKIEFDINKDPAIPPVEADENKLRVVLENLIDNAIKYTEKGGKVTVRLSGQKLNSAGEIVEISVSDSGIGIPPEDKSKIFGKFFRSANAVSFEPDGSGIGLYMSKDIVEKHGGTLSYETSDKGGTTFHLVLPVRQAGR